MNKPFTVLLFTLIPILATANELTLTEEQAANARYTTTKVTERQIQPHLKLNGALTADLRKSHGVAPVIDGMVTELLVVANEKVRKGQVLARLRSPSLGKAQADYLSALAHFELAQSERTRVEGLWKDGIVAQSRWLAADSEYKSARAILEANRRLLILTGLSDKQIKQMAQHPERLAEFELTSPTDGTVTEVVIEPGQLLAAGQTAFHVDDLSTLWAEVQIPVAELPQIELQAEATIKVQADPNREYIGYLQSLGGEVERQNQTLSGRIMVDNKDGRLRPGMYANIVLHGIASDGLAVPSSSVFRIGDQNYLFKVPGPQRFEPVPVEIASSSEGWTQIRRGIDAQVMIVQTGVAELKSQWQYQGGE